VELREKVEFLSDPHSYDFDAKQVEVRETHMSWVFLAGDFVFKLKKPVRLPYLDFSTLAKRRLACTAEVELNRRLAPKVYLGVVPLCIRGNRLAVGSPGRIIDWLVKMQRLDRDCMLDRLIETKRLHCKQISELAVTLANFYRTAKPVHLMPEEHLRRWKTHIRENRGPLLNPRFDLPRGLIRYLDRTLRQFIDQRKDVLLERVRRRRILDGHGDLRPEHICITNRITIIDCLEFNTQLRSIDPFEEIAYLDLECELLGLRGIGNRLGFHVSRALHDNPPNSLFHFYRCYRAMLRARLSIAHLLAPKPRTPEKWRPQALAYLSLATDDAKRMQAQLRTRASPTAVRFREDGIWLPPEGGRREGLRFCRAPCPPSPGTAARCR
jgi:aminoglycoside phosphotransferase family enzyme